MKTRKESKYEYLLAHKNNNVYLRYIGEYKHYVKDIEDASTFTLRKAKALLKKYKYPENWVIVKREKDRKYERFSKAKSK